MGLTHRQRKVLAFITEQLEAGCNPTHRDPLAPPSLKALVEQFKAKRNTLLGHGAP